MSSMALWCTSNTTGPLPSALPSAMASRRPPGRCSPVSAWNSPLMPPAQNTPSLATRLASNSRPFLSFPGGNHTYSKSHECPATALLPTGPKPASHASPIVASTAAPSAVLAALGLAWPTLKVVTRLELLSAQPPVKAQSLQGDSNKVHHAHSSLSAAPQGWAAALTRDKMRDCSP